MPLNITLCCLELNHRGATSCTMLCQERQKHRLLTPKQKGLNFPALVGYCLLGRLAHASLPGSWITAAIEAQWGQSYSVCLGFIHRQEACEQSKARALFQPESAA